MPDPLTGTDFNPLWITVVIGVAAVLVLAGRWIGHVNADRSSFKEFIAEVRSDIKAILVKLSPAVVSSGSPLRLTELGRKISAGVNAKEIAQGLVAVVLPKVEGESAYDIQAYCFAFLDDCDLLGPKIDEIKQCAFENGLEQSLVRRVIAVELRDLLLAELLGGGPDQLGSYEVAAR